MIRNGREYRITKAQAKRFEQALAQLPKERSIEKGVHPLLAKAQKDALQSQLQSLRKQIKDYERLRRGGGKALDVTSIEKLPQSLIRARIANSKGIGCADWNKGAAGSALRSDELCFGEPVQSSAGGANSGSTGVTTTWNYSLCLFVASLVSISCRSLFQTLPPC